MCVCVLGGGSLPREHNKLFVFIMHLAFEKRMKVSLFYLTLSSTVQCTTFGDLILDAYATHHLVLLKYLQPAL